MNIKVHSVVIGPHTPPELVEGEYLMIVSASIDGEATCNFELYSENFNWLYEIQSWCLDNIEPYVITCGPNETDKDEY